MIIPEKAPRTYKFLLYPNLSATKTFILRSLSLKLASNTCIKRQRSCNDLSSVFVFFVILFEQFKGFLAFKNSGIAFRQNVSFLHLRANLLGHTRYIYRTNMLHLISTSAIFCQGFPFPTVPSVPSAPHRVEPKYQHECFGHPSLCNANTKYCKLISLFGVV